MTNATIITKGMINFNFFFLRLAVLLPPSTVCVFFSPLLIFFVLHVFLFYTLVLSRI